MSAIEKYLRRYSEPETSLLTGFPALSWHYCLLIPAYREPAAFLRNLCREQLSDQSVVLILVINQPDSDNPLNSEYQPHPDNVALKTSARSMGDVLWQSNHLTLHSIRNSSSALLVVDRFSHHPIPRKQGVGRARKIAADLALQLIHWGQINTPWLYCTDADSTLPADYFAATLDNPAAAACIYPFTHQCGDDATGNATHLYEQALTHYVNGLKRAGSPYAFQTIGSTLAVNSEHYAQVRGFPKRAGGEDFYLLNKLAKTGDVISLEKPIIQLHARRSDRVPFGTGPAIEKILVLENPAEEFQIYHPAIFDELASWLTLMPELWEYPDRLGRLSRHTNAVLTALGVLDALAHGRRQSKNHQTFCKHMHTWFDAFMTLKFVHGLQASAYPPVSIKSLF
jgi:hypothetical protein